MACIQFNASAPASVMLFGEHAVLYGKSAIACALAEQIHVTLTLRDDDQVHIASSLGAYTTSIDQLTPTPPFQFVLAVLQHYQQSIKQGFNLDIQAEFSHQVGLGSSAAVTVATIAVMGKWLNQPLNDRQFFLLAREIIRSVQGLGSGLDALASINGGVVVYTGASAAIEMIPLELPLILIYSGVKTPTAEVVKHVAKYYQQHPAECERLFTAMQQCTHEAVPLLKEQRWAEVGWLMDQHQQLQERLGVNTPALAHIIASLKQGTHIFGAKISGSGLGDCVIALGRLNDDVAHWLKPPYALIPAVMSTEGVNVR